MEVWHDILFKIPFKLPIKSSSYKKKLIDIFYLIRSPKILPKDIVVKGFTSLEILKKNYKKRYKITSKLVKDNITIYKR